MDKTMFLYNKEQMISHADNRKDRKILEMH